MGTRWRRIVAVSAWLLGAALAAPAAGNPRAVAELRQATFTAAGAAPQSVELPHRWEDTAPSHSGRGEYRLTFPAVPADGLLAVYIERACADLEVRLNGERIGGTLEASPSRDCYRPQLFTLPRSLLWPEGNELRIDVVGPAAGQVTSRQRAAGLSAVQVGPVEMLEPRYRGKLFWSITVAQLAAALMAAAGVGAVALSMVRRQDGRLLYFGLYAASWALVSARMFAPSLPFGPVAAEILAAALLGVTFCCVYVFLLRMVERRWRWIERAWWAQVALSPLALALAAPDHLLPVAQVFYVLYFLEFVAVAAFFFRTAWRERREHFWGVGSAVLATATMVGIEASIQARWVRLPDVALQNLMVPVIAAVIGLHLVRQFALALRRTEQAKAELERRVAEKSREIEENWRQIAQLRAAEAAQHERRRIASDLHDDLGARLLGITQASRATGAADGARVAEMARLALDEMRLAVRGMTAAPALAADVLADWRAECVARLEAAGVVPQWQADEPPADLLLPSRVQVQCTRVLREAVSNVIRHSGATHCGVRIAWEQGGLLLEVRDDGRGLPATAASRGHGLTSIEGRIRGLAGWHRFDEAPGGGTRLAAWVPVAPSANMDAL